MCGAGREGLFGLEGFGLGDFLDEVLEGVVMVGHAFGELVDERAVGNFEASAEGVGEEFFGEAAAESRGVGEEEFFEFGEGLELASVGEFAGGVDGFFDAGFVGAPGAGGVEVLEAETEGVDLLVATVAGGAFVAVLFHALAEGEGFGAFFIWLDFPGVGRGRGDFGAEEVFEDPDAAFDGFGACAVGEASEHAGVGDETAAGGAFGELDAAEVVAVDAFDAVVAGEALVEEGEAGVEEVEGAEVVVEDFGEEVFGFGDEGAFEVVVVFGEEFFVGGEAADETGLEPLADEVFDEARGLAVGDHAADLFGEDVGLGEGAIFGAGEEFVVGEAAPKEVGKSGGEFVGGKGAGLLGVGLGKEEEVRGAEDGGEGGADGLDKGAAGSLFFLEEFEEVVGFGVGRFTAVGAGGESLEDFAGIVDVFFGVGTLEEDAAVGFRGPGFVDGTFDLHPVEGEGHGLAVRVVGVGEFEDAAGGAVGDFDRDEDFYGLGLGGDVAFPDLGAFEIHFEPGRELAAIEGVGTDAEGVEAVAVEPEGVDGGEPDALLGTEEEVIVAHHEAAVEGTVSLLSGEAVVLVFDFEAPFDGVGAFAGDNCAGEEFFSGSEVLLHEQRGHGEGAANVVEAVGGVVGGKEVGGGSREAEEILDGVVVFVAVKAAEDDATGAVFGFGDATL